MAYTCPNCKCYTVKGPAIEGAHDLSYVRCYDNENTWELAYYTISILGGQTLYLCAVEDSITCVDADIMPTGIDCTLNSPCVVPEAYCYEVTLDSGTSAVFTYIVPDDGSGHANMTEFGSLSTMLGVTSLIVCAREGSIIQTAGNGTISIGPAGWVCETTPVCSLNCICVTLTNDEIDGYDVFYNYRDCNTGQLVGYQTLAQGDSISFCMLENTFEVSDGASLYTLTINGDCEGSPECAGVTPDQLCVSTPEWATTNLAVTTYANGDEIPLVTDPFAWASLTTGARCCPNGDCSPGNIATYGYLYNWYAVDDFRGLAPLGFRIPTDVELTALVNCLGGLSVAGGKMKETGTSHWLSPNTGATNSSGFTALPSGVRSEFGGFFNYGEDGNYWTSTELGTTAWAYLLSYGATNVIVANFDKGNGMSVRYIAD
jgi:uncharacterized protein (TIGR02145 family)